MLEDMKMALGNIGDVDIEERDGKSYITITCGSKSVTVGPIDAKPNSDPVEGYQEAINLLLAAVAMGKLLN